MKKKLRVIIGRQLAQHPQFITLGLKPNLDDYNYAERNLMMTVSTIYYPTNAFVEQLYLLGKRTFPSLSCYLMECDKIRQSIFFNLAGLTHPRTIIFHRLQQSKIERHFKYPFIAKNPRRSAQGKGIFLIKESKGLTTYLNNLYHNPAYIQEKLSIKRDVRVIVINFEPVCVYWRISPIGDFRSNIAQGAKVDFQNIPPSIVDLAVKAACRGGLNEIGIDVALVKQKPLLLECNMRYGHKGPFIAGINITDWVSQKILSEEL